MGPWAATGVALLAALALNAWTANLLWLGYTLFGTFVFIVLFALVRHRGWRIPTRAVWCVGLAASLHYVGGSLSGLHSIGGPNGLYYAFPWWDNLVHGLGSAAVAAAACAAILPFLPRLGAVLLATCVGVAVGTLVELYEFAQFLLFGTVDQGFYTNTLVDLYSNLVGSAAGALLYGLPQRAGTTETLPAAASRDP